MKQHHQVMLQELEEIQEQLEELSSKAQYLISKMPTNIRNTAEAYRVADFGTSVNPYDTTLESIIKDFTKWANQIEDDDE